MDVQVTSLFHSELFFLLPYTYCFLMKFIQVDKFTSADLFIVLHYYLFNIYVSSNDILSFIPDTVSKSFCFSFWLEIYHSINLFKEPAFVFDSLYCFLVFNFIDFHSNFYYCFLLLVLSLIFSFFLVS